MTIGEMQKRKKELNYTYRQIAELSGLPVGTVQKILGGITKSPRYGSLQALEGVLGPDRKPDSGKNSGIRLESWADRHGGQADLVREDFSYHAAETGSDTSPDAGPSADPGGKGYSLEDYLSLPDERRAELIDGVFFDLAAPSLQHQRLIGMIYRQLCEYAEKNLPGCEVFFAPLDVQLDDPDRNTSPKDVKTIVEPDLLVICEEHKDRIGEFRIFGAPDMTIEILSRSTRKKDMILKLKKYDLAGVREYWIVDPDKEKVIVYTFGDEPDVSIYGFGQEIPVAISGGRCTVKL